MMKYFITHRQFMYLPTAVSQCSVSCLKNNMSCVGDFCIKQVKRKQTIKNYYALNHFQIYKTN